MITIIELKAARKPKSDIASSSHVAIIYLMYARINVS